MCEPASLVYQGRIRGLSPAWLSSEYTMSCCYKGLYVCWLMTSFIEDFRYPAAELDAQCCDTQSLDCPPIQHQAALRLDSLSLYG